MNDYLNCLLEITINESMNIKITIIEQIKFQSQIILKKSFFKNIFLYIYHLYIYNLYFKFFKKSYLL